MSAIPKKKLCWNCEGRVAFTDENCPFCGVYLSSSSLITQQEENSTHLAPYKNVTDKSVPASPYDIKNQNDREIQEEDDVSIEALQEEADFSQKNYLMSFLLLLAGSVFLMFGLVLLVFSREGTLTLQWNASYWFIYLGVAISLFFLGWRSLRN